VSAPDMRMSVRGPQALFSAGRLTVPSQRPEAVRATAARFATPENEAKFYVLFVFVSVWLKPDLNCAAILLRSSLYATSHASQQN
jgi:hypothetical protein